MNNKKKKVLYAKIGIASLIVIFIVCAIIFSPTILSKIRGNATSTNTTTSVDVKNGVVITTDLIYDNSGVIKLKVYNGSGKDITVKKLVSKEFGNNDAYSELALYSNSVALADDGTLKTTEADSGGKKYAILENDKDYIITADNIHSTLTENIQSTAYEIGIVYEMEVPDETNTPVVQNFRLTTSSLSITDFDSSLINAVNSVFPAIETTNFTIATSDNNAHSVTITLPNKVVMDLSESLTNASVNYSVSSEGTINFSNPLTQSSLSKNIFGQANTSNIDEYFSLSGIENTDGFISNSGTFILSGTPIDLADNVKVIPGLYFTETKDSNIYSSELETPYSGTLPSFQLTIYDKSNLKTAIENAYIKIKNCDEETTDLESFIDYRNTLLDALNIYVNRYEYSDTEINQTLIDDTVAVLNTTEILEKQKANYTSLDAAVARANALKTKYPSDDFTDLNNLLAKKEENLTSNYQIKVDNLTSKINEKTLAFSRSKLADILTLVNTDYSSNPGATYVGEDGSTESLPTLLYTDESWNALQTKITKAKQDNTNKNFTAEQQDEILTLVDDVTNAINALEKNPADYSNINDMKNIYISWKNSGYIKESEILKLDEFFNSIKQELKIDETGIIRGYETEAEELLIPSIKSAKGIYISDPSNGKSLEAVYNFIINSDPSNFVGDSKDDINSLKSDLYSEKYVIVNGTRYEVFTDSSGYKNAYYYDQSGRVDIDKFQVTYVTFEEYISEMEYKWAPYQSMMDATLNELYSNINSLTFKSGSYDELCNYYSKATKLNREYYENYDLVTQALWNINWEFTALDQHEIDLQTAKLKNAIDSLIIKSADLSLLKDAYSKAISLNKNNYINYSILETAIEDYPTVVNYRMDKQSEIDDLTKKINTAISKLTLKSADYSKIEVLKSQIEQLDSSKYTNFSNINAALDAIIYGKKVDEQSSVDTMYNNLKSAFGSLVKKSENLADYSTLRNYISKIPADYSDYTTEQQNKIKSVLKEVKALSLNLQSEEQQIVDNLTQKVVELLVALNVDVYDTESSAIVLSSLKVNGNKVNLTSVPFKYTVSYDTVEAVISVGLSSKTSTYKVYGGSVILPGDNNITISVTTSDGTIYNYKLIVTRSTTSDYLSDLSVKDSAIAFDKNKQTYTVKIDKDINKLDLSAIAEDENATVKIIGNDNIKNGSKVKVEVTSQDGTVRVYTLDVQKAGSVDAKVIIILILILCILAGVFKVIQNKNKTKENNI